MEVHYHYNLPQDDKKKMLSKCLEKYTSHLVVHSSGTYTTTRKQDFAQNSGGLVLVAHTLFAPNKIVALTTIPSSIRLTSLLYIRKVLEK